MSAGYYTAFLTGKARRQHLAIADDDLAPDEGVERAAASAYDADKEEENLLDIDLEEALEAVLAGNDKSQGLEEAISRMQDNASNASEADGVCGEWDSGSGW